MKNTFFMIISFLSGSQSRIKYGFKSLPAIKQVTDQNFSLYTIQNLTKKQK